jgi:anti-sigma factor RsiW
MNIVASTTSIAQVHAYVDGQLDDAHAEIVEQYLDERPEKFDELQTYISINDQLHDIYDSVLSEAIPESMLDSVYNEPGPDRTVGGLEKRVRRRVDNFFQTVTNEHMARVAYFWERGKNKTAAVLRLNVIAEKPWFIATRTRISHVWDRFTEVNVTALKFLKLHPATIPPWVQYYAGGVRNGVVRTSASLRTMNVAAVVALLAVGMMAGIYLHNQVLDSGRSANITKQALKTHMFYTSEGRTVLEAGASKTDDLLLWISNRLGSPVKTIDLTEIGFNLVGSIVVPASPGYGMATVYENESLEKVTIYVSADQKDRGYSDVNCYKPGGANSLCTWAAENIRYAIISDLPVGKIKQFAELVQN